MIIIKYKYLSSKIIFAIWNEPFLQVLFMIDPGWIIILRRLGLWERVNEVRFIKELFPIIIDSNEGKSVIEKESIISRAKPFPSVNSLNEGRSYSLIRIHWRYYWYNTFGHSKNYHLQYPFYLIQEDLQENKLLFILILIILSCLTVVKLFDEIRIVVRAGRSILIIIRDIQTW